MVKIHLKIVVIIGSIILSGSLYGQKKVRLDNAERMIGSVKASGERFDRVIGNVVFKQKETTIYSDSAHFYRQRNFIEAFGNVRIEEGDSVTITAGKLIYDGNDKTAKLRKNVVFHKLNQMKLYTDFLNYNRTIQEARYFQGGKLVDSTNVLTSRKGYYLVKTSMASFKGNVVGTNVDYTLESDTLQYNTRNKTVYFRDETQVTNQNGDMATYYEGSYNTVAQRSDLAKGEVDTESYTLTGDKLRLDEKRKFYTATGNVEMISKEQDIIITGENSFFDKSKGVSKVYGNALMKKILQEDTLYLTADTLVAIENEDPTKKRLLAYNNVKIFKSDLQGKADSLAYHTSDSVLFFYDDPVLWTSDNQLSADSIDIRISNGMIDRLNLNVNSFVISEDSISNYNQIKGRKMIAHFIKGKLKNVDVNGNAESLFFAIDEENLTLMGMNKMLSSNMVIKFKDNRADNASSYVKPDASFIPPHELEPEQKQLAGFEWRESEKPIKSELLKGQTQPVPIEKKKNIKDLDSRSLIKRKLNN